MQDITVNEFTCRRDDLTIRGQTFQKQGISEKLPAVIISHGFTSNMKRTRPYGEYIASLGFRAFTFDFCGGGLETTSDGSFTDMTPISETEDLRAVIDYVFSREDVDPERLSLMGCSQGGFVSGLVASKRNDIRSLILFYPALCIPDDARNGSMQTFCFDPDNMPETIVSGPYVLGRNYPLSVMDMDINKELVKYKNGPVFIIHGTADAIVPVRYAKDAYESFRKSNPDQNVILELLEGGPHGFDGAYFEKACEKLAAFLKENAA